ncbi:MAG TPA: hypothetical protein VNV88_06965 [Candidatus Solibacter sp.]|jgi:hypothetical protein|nr:hypothetical protein [Candidatus Solibacter sp.]
MKYLVVCSLFLLSTCFAQDTQKDTQKHGNGSKEAVQESMEVNQHNAVGAMRTLNVATSSYYVTYAVYPATLSAMSEPPGDSKDYNKDHAGLLTKQLGCANEPCTFHNYLFSCKKTDAGYVITARPKKYGVDGRLSLYSDESAVVRATLEDREATEKDKPVGTGQ